MKNKYLFTSLVVWLLVSLLLPADIVLSSPQSFITLDLANVHDCPDDLDQQSASRVVMQHIDGLFYKWEEYDLDDNGAFCIYMQKPERRMLSLGEAKALLEESAGWIDEHPPENKLKLLDPMHPSLQGLPVEAPVSIDLPILNGKLSIGQDQPAKVLSHNDVPLQEERTAAGDNDTRERVTETTSYPWNTVGYIVVRFNSDGKMGRGSGFIVTPYMVLTAAHVVYSRERDEYVGGVHFVPGQHQESEGEAVIQPYGSFTADSWHTDNIYTDPDTPDGDRHMSDYAAIFFNGSFTDAGVSTYMPIMFDNSPKIDDVINVAGYPTEVQGESNSNAMWFSTGRISRTDESRIIHEAYISSGNSGGPVWQKLASGQRRVIAVNVAEGDDDGELGHFGLGTRLAQHNQHMIEEWMSWVPSDEPLNAANTEGGDSGGCFMATMDAL